MASMGPYKYVHVLKKINCLVMMCEKDSDNIAVAVFCWSLSSVSVTLCCTTLFGGRFHYLSDAFHTAGGAKKCVYILKNHQFCFLVMCPFCQGKRQVVHGYSKSPCNLGNLRSCFLRDLPSDVPDVP